MDYDRILYMKALHHRRPDSHKIGTGSTSLFCDSEDCSMSLILKVYVFIVRIPGVSQNSCTLPVNVMKAADTGSFIFVVYSIIISTLAQQALTFNIFFRLLFISNYGKR